MSYFTLLLSTSENMWITQELPECKFIFILTGTMADVNKLVFSMIRFLQDQKTNSSLDDEKVESIEGILQFTLYSMLSIDHAIPQHFNRNS